jgi:iron complex outermembrane recepter protein
LKLFLATLLAVLLASTSLSQVCNLQLSGHVEDADTKDKLLSASVSILETGRTIVTDAKGDFSFAGLCPGEYTLRITHIDCEPVERKVALSKNQHIDLFMPHARKTLGELTLEAQRGIANTGFKKELSGKALAESRGLSLAEALSKINGVTMLQTGSTIAKPVIHGLHSNRILTINNGVRQEGQQWGNEHAPEIDPFIADKLVVIKGVDELRYGSDAIGGVILVEPKALRSPDSYRAMAGEINAAYFTNNRQFVLSGVLEHQLKKHPAFRYRFQGTFKKGGNAATPGYRLNNTGSEEKNFSVTLAWKKKRFGTELFYSHFSTRLGIFTGSHIGNLTDLLNAIAAPRPSDVFLGQQTYAIERPRQEVAHHLIKSKSLLYSGGHKFSLLVAGQFNRRQEFDVVRSSANTQPQLDLSIYTLSQDLSWEHPKKNNFSGTAGISAVQQRNSYSGRYFIPNYFAYTFGGYYIEKWSKHHWELQAGVRFDNKSIATNRLKFNGDTINYDFNFSTFAASLNTIYRPNEQWRLNATVSLASRAPYVNELLSDGIHHGTATYERGDIALKPERSLNLSIGAHYQHPSQKIELDVLAYSNRINGFIYQQPNPGSPVLTIAGAFPLLNYRQTDALLSGADISVSAKPFAALEWTGKAAVLYARNRTAADWLILMPANRFSNEFTWHFKDGKTVSGAYLSAEWMYVAEQTRVPSDKNGKQDYKAAPPAYNLVNLQASATMPLFKKQVTLGVGVRNLLDAAYRDYLNGLRYFTDEMGRNISLRLKLAL